MPSPRTDAIHAERAAIVAWIRSYADTRGAAAMRALHSLARRIEFGEHVRLDGRSGPTDPAGAAREERRTALAYLRRYYRVHRGACRTALEHVDETITHGRHEPY